MIKKKKINEKKSDFVIRGMLILSIIICIILIIINKIATPQIHWAELVIAGIVYIWITTIYSINRNINIAAHVLIQTIAISLLMIYVDYVLGFKKWSLSIGVPIVMIISNITMLILTIVSYKKYIRYAIYQLILFLINFIPVILIIENIIEFKILTYISIGFQILSFLISLILCGRDLKDTIIRNFHM